MGMRDMTLRMEATQREMKVMRWASYFFEEYVPAAYALGYLVRTAYWEGQSEGTGHCAREALQQALLLLHAMLGDRAAHNDYGRGLVMALLTWTSWHDQLPGCAFVEESCEAQLSRLGAACKRSHSSFTPEQVNDLYLNVGPLKTTLHDTTRHPVASELLTRVRTNLQRAWRDGLEKVVTWVPWKSGRTCVAREAWPTTLPVMRELGDVSVEELLRNVHRTLGSVTGGPELTLGVKHDFDSQVPLRSIADRARVRNALETLQRVRYPHRAAAQRRGGSMSTAPPPPAAEASQSQRSDASRPSRPRTLPLNPIFEEGPPILTNLHPVAPAPAPLANEVRLVGIPDHATDSD
jgi:hypothetical protein